MSGIFNPSIFNNAAFNVGVGGVVVQPVVKTGTGGIDAEDQKRRYKGRIYKPTGLVDRKKVVEQRVKESRDIQKEVFDEVIKPQLDQPLEFKPIESMTAAEVDREIAFLMKEKMMSDERDEMMMLIMALDE
jgi:hypothetical protein